MKCNSIELRVSHKIGERKAKHVQGRAKLAKKKIKAPRYKRKYSQIN